MKRLYRSAFVALAIALPQMTDAGSFITVNQDEPDRVAHQNYYGAGGELTAIRVCLDNSINPDLATAAEPAVRNVIATYNRFRSLPDNTFATGTDTSAPPDQVDFETVLLHEFMHAHGLDHPNQADNPAGGGTYLYYDSRSGGGDNGMLDHLGNADGLAGSPDDERGDDVNLVWYPRGSNDPAVLPAVVDTTTMAHVLDYLPAGQHFAANGNADVMAALGHPNSKAVAVQGYVQGRVGHHLHNDDMAMLRLARAGLDGIAGTDDDYHGTAMFAGYYNNPQGGECHMVVRFDDENGHVGFASTLVGLSPLTARNHWRLNYPTRTRFNPAVNWYFTPGANTVMQIDAATPATSAGITPYAVQVTVGKAAYNTMSGTPRGTVVVRDGPRDDAQTATCSIDLTPTSGGTGSCTLAPLAAGHKTLTADYVGWGGWDGNTATATHDSTGTVSFSSVTHTPSPSGVGVAVAFDWTLAPPANGAPVQASGEVVVKEVADCASAPVDPANQCTATLPAHTCSIAFSSTGTHTLQLCYGGDSAVASAHTSVSHAVLAGRPTTTSILGQSAALTKPFEPYSVQVQVLEAPNQGGHPQGVVIVRDGDDGNPLTARCTATLAGSANGTASCQLASNRAGVHALTASFTDQGTWTGSSSASVTHTVRDFAIVANTPSRVPLGQGASVVVALDVAPFAGTPAPSGTIVVGDGADSCQIVLPASQCLWRGSSVGPHLLTASWSGDANYPAMSTGAVTQTVEPAQNPRWVSQPRDGYVESNAASTGSNLGLSADGRYVVFSSTASDLVTDDGNGVEDVFVRDQSSGAVRRVSVTADGTQGNGPSRFPSISADGRYVSFQSEASNFYPGDDVDKDVFVKDLYSGALVRATTLADGSAPTTPELGFASTQLRSSLSADGRYVAFSTYRALKAGDVNGRVDVYVRDLSTGALDLISSNSADLAGDSHSQFPAISADGRYVAYISSAANLVPGAGGTGLTNLVYVKDRLTRATSLASATAAGTQGDGTCVDPAINADGRYVAFRCSSSNLPIVGWNGDRVFVKDMSTGAIELVVQSTGYGPSLTPALSADGRYVAFQVGVTSAPSHVAVFVKDRQTGIMTDQHVTPGGAPALEEQVSWEPRMWPSISADGRFVAFQSISPAVAPTDINGVADIFVRDRSLALTRRASGAYSGLRNDGDSGGAVIARDGSQAFYDSASTRVVDADANNVRDVFRYRSDTGATTRLSTAADGTPGNGASYAPVVADDVGDVYFLSAANNLVAGDTNGKVDVFRKQLADGGIERINLSYGSQLTSDVQAPLAVSRDGRIVAYTAPDGGIPNDHNGVTDIVISRRGGSTVMLTPGSNGNSLQPALSDDGRILAFASDATNFGVGGNAVRNVFARNLRELIADPVKLVSTNAGGIAANGNSEQPAVSADGRYVAFVSRATNLVPGDTNSVADIFVKDIETGAIERVNTSAAGAQGSGGDCSAPAFSSGARFVGFVCAQGDLLAGGDGTPAYYVKDRSTGAITRQSQNAAGIAADAASSATSRALADGGMAVFASAAGNLAGLDAPLVGNVYMSPYPAAFTASTVSILSISPTTPEAGRGYTVNVSVAGSATNPPSGRVRVFDGTDNYPTCIAVLTPGTPSTGSCQVSTGQSGYATLTAYYGGDDANGAAASSPYTVPIQDPVVPGKPTIASAVAGNGSVTLQLGINNIGSPFTGYTATCGTQVQNSSGVPITVSGLQNGVAVNCTVVVHNSIGDSPASDPVSATPRAGTSTAITAHAPNPSRVNAAYTVSVAVLGEGTPAPGGQVTISDGAAACTATLTPGTPSSGSCALTSTSRGSRTLTATYGGDAANTGSSGTAAHAVADLPAAPTLTQATPGNGRVTLSFGTPADDGGSVLLDYTAACGTQSATGVSPLAVTGLANGSPVTCSVTARNVLGTGAPSNVLSATPATTPAKPTITGVQPGDGSLAVAFTGSASDGGSAIDYYRAICGGHAVNGLASPIVVTGLANGTAVQCLLVAHNAMGSSAAAGPVTATPAAAPSAPVLTAAQPGDGRVTLVFDAPASNGGSAILDYTATCGSHSATGLASPLPVTGLTNDVEVSCQVTARNAVSPSAPSNALTATPAPSRVHTTLALSSGAEPSSWNQSLTFTATLAPVAPASATPTGTVSFSDGATPLAGCTSLALTATAPITAACTTSALSVGTHAITARYSGDATYAAGVQPISDTLNHTVQRAMSSVDFSTLNFVYDGSAKTIAAHIHDESASSCTVTPSSVGPNAGSTPVTAACNGTNYTASGNAAAVIAKATTTLALSSTCLRTFVEGQPYTLVASLSGGVNATGSVDFKDGQNALCGNVALGNGTATCRATLSAHQQAVATLALGASYGGDANNAASQASPWSVTVLGLIEAIFRNGFDVPGNPDACPIE